MSPNEIRELLAAEKENARDGVASIALACLRHLRDNHPNEWDNLLKVDSDSIIPELWDYLRENQV